MLTNDCLSRLAPARTSRFESGLPQVLNQPDLCPPRRPARTVRQAVIGPARKPPPPPPVCSDHLRGLFIVSSALRPLFTAWCMLRDCSQIKFCAGNRSRKVSRLRGRETSFFEPVKLRAEAGQMCVVFGFFYACVIPFFRLYMTAHLCIRNVSINSRCSLFSQSSGFGKWDFARG